LQGLDLIIEFNGLSLSGWDVICLQPRPSFV